MKNLKKISSLLGGALLCSSLLFSCGPAKVGNKVSKNQWEASFEEILNVKTAGVKAGDSTTANSVKVKDDTNTNTLEVKFESGIKIATSGLCMSDFATTAFVAKGLDIQYITDGDTKNQNIKSPDGIYTAIWATYTPEEGKVYEYFRWHKEDAKNKTADPVNFSNNDENSPKDTGFAWVKYSKSNIEDSYEMTCKLFSQLKDKFSEDRWDESKGGYKFKLLIDDDTDIGMSFPEDENNISEEQPAFDLWVRFNDSAKVSEMYFAISEEYAEYTRGILNNPETANLQDSEIKVMREMLDQTIKIGVEYFDNSKTISQITGYELPTTIREE